MNILTNQASMNSLQIADLVNSDYTDVNRSVERLAGRGVIELPPMEKVEQKQSLSPNNKRSAYIFTGEKGKRDSLIVVAQLSPEFTGAIVDKWIELERAFSSNAPVMPTNYLEALEQLVEKEKRLIAAQPKIDHYDAVVECSTLLNATQVAQSIGLPSAYQLNLKLGVLNVYNDNIKRGRVFKAWFINKGLGEMKQADSGHLQPLFTTKGQAWAFEKLGGL